MIGIFMRRWAVVAVLALVCFPALAAEKGEKSKSTNITVGTLKATLFDRSRASGVLLVDINLTLANEDNKDKVTAMLPILNDRYLALLSARAATTYSLNRPINLPSLTAALQQVTNKVMGSPIALVQISNLATQRL